MDWLWAGEEFQSTSSVWRTTCGLILDNYTLEISIHVLRVEDDSVLITGKRCEVYFNPRPPCGGRLFGLCLSCFSGISIHVLRVEDDYGFVEM